MCPVGEIVMQKIACEKVFTRLYPNGVGSVTIKCELMAKIGQKTFMITPSIRLDDKAFFLLDLLTFLPFY